jgi:gliding motility-associated protein GldM
MKKILYKYLIISILCLFSCAKEDTQIAEKFIFLNVALEHQLESMRSGIEGILSSLKKKIEREGNTMAGRQRIKRAEELKKQTARLIGDIDKLKSKIIKEIGQGVDVKTGVVMKPFAKSGIYNLLVAENGVGKDLENKLNLYRDFILKEFSDLDFFAKNTPSLTENDPNYLKKYFGNTTVIEGLALLTERQHQVIQLEIRVLQRLLNLNELAEATAYKGFLPIVIPENDSFNVGDLLQTQIFMGGIMQKAGMKMTFNGKDIPIENGIGKVRLVAQGKGWQTWQGSVTFNYRGRDTTLTIQQRYFVMPK